MQVAAVQDQRPTRLFIGGNDLVAQAQFVAQLDRRRQLVDEAVSAELHQQPVVAPRLERASQPLASLEQLNVRVGQQIS